MKTFTGNNQYSNLTVEERFWQKVDKKSDDGCWEWLGAKCSGGYGSFNQDGISISAHRMAWILTYGDIPEIENTDFRGTCVLHKCDNRKCVNPSHLFLGSADDNMKDMARKGRGKTREENGEHNPMSKLTNDDVLEMRKLYSTGNYRQLDLANIYNIKFQTVSNIVRRETWRHI